MSTPALVQALLDPTVSPLRGDRVELVETHISWVLLAHDRVYKIKKPVDLGFLDFTTLEQRRFYCLEEVRLNRRLAPEVYLGVVELTGTPERPRLGDGRPVIEVAVEMLRLPADRMLDRLVQEERVEPGLLEGIGRTVADFHSCAESGAEVDAFGSLDTIRRNWEENFAQTASLSADELPPDWREELRAWIAGFLGREANRFSARVEVGRIRDCHGDLQAQHVCCVEPIQIFDCIEFNRRFRYGDTAGEIAFLTMDLERLGRPDLATRFLNAYLEESGDWDAVPLLDFYGAYRAFLRGKVLAFQVAERPEVSAPARGLFAHSVAYARPRRTPRLLVTSGIMGVGKSTVARAAAERIGAVLIRTDAIRKRLAGVPLQQRAADAFGEGLYSTAMGRRTYAEALQTAGRLLAAGWPIVLDGSFSRRAERDEARHLASRLGVPSAVLWCNAPDDIVVDRLRARAADRHEVSDGRLELFAEHRARYEPPSGELDVVRLDTAGDRPVALDGILERPPGERQSRYGASD